MQQGQRKDKTAVEYLLNWMKIINKIKHKNDTGLEKQNLFNITAPKIAS